VAEVDARQREAALTSDGASRRIADAGDLSRAGRRAPEGYLRQSWRRFRRNRVATFALGVTILILLFSFGAPLISKFITHKTLGEQVLLDRFKPPFSPGYILGADNLGRDVLTRLAYGGRVSMTVAILAMLSAFVIGGSLGSIAGYYGRWIDSVIMRFVDVMLSIPALFLLIFINTLFSVGATMLALVIASVSWMGLARLVRGEVMSLRARDYVEAARVVGASDRRIIMRHMFPNVIPLVIVWSTLVIPVFIIVEASLSYLGLGVQVPTPSWGNMLTDAQSFMAHSWTLAVIPGLMIFITVLSINLLGNGLRDALDPRLAD
jgi:peptide/nickel transport system permease protein